MARLNECPCPDCSRELISDMNSYVLEWIATMARYRSTRGHCECCGSPYWGPMLKNEVWAEVVKHLSVEPTAPFYHRRWDVIRAVLCGDCMAKLLGRPLTTDDLNSSPWNRYRAAYMLILIPEKRDVI